tara:strand:+ start:1446 stop:4451 length:3006 start_codon:yes stop_codon:yes gene_type:complete
MAERREQPLSYIVWLQSQTSEVTSESALFNLYNEYVREFFKEHSDSSSEAQKNIVSQYVDLLKDITINYTSIQERRFLSNIDFTNRQELDTILPFYVKRIREITQYIAKKRQNIGFKTLQNSFKGSVEGVETIIKDIVFDLITDEAFIGNYPNSVIPPLSSIAYDLIVDVHPLYDNYQNYFDIDPEIDKDVYVHPKNDELYRLFPGNVQEKEPFSWLDLLEAVNVLFDEIPEFLLGSDGISLVTADNKPLAGNTVRTLNDIEQLPLKYFLDGSKEVDSLVIDSQALLNEKFAGTDFYYLSTGTSTTQYVSGLLYEAKNPVANYLNKYWSSHAVVSNRLNLKTEKSVGLFFTPHKQGILNYHSIDFYYDFDTENLLPNSIYLFPDPEQAAAGRGSTKVDQSSVYKHYDDVSLLKSTRLNHSQEGEIVNDQNLQKFYPYQSREETLGRSVHGISRSTDDFDFWIGEEKDIWSHPDVYEIIPIKTFPFDSKINDLLITDSIVYEWKTDIFGNDYALIKDTKPQRKTSEQISGNLTKTAIQDDFSSVNNSLYNPVTGSFKYQDPPYYNYQLSNHTTVYTSRNNNITAANLPYERLDAPGKLYFRNLYSTDISPASSALSGIFVKYETSTDIYNEINDNIRNFDIIRDTIILETDNFLIVERFNYDLESATFTSILPYRAIMSLSGTNRSLEKFGNIYYDEHTTDIFLTKTVLHPFLSASNYKIVYPNIFKFNIQNKTFKDVFSLQSLLRSISSTDQINEHDNTYKYLSGQGYSMNDVFTVLARISAEYINVTSIDRPLLSINAEENTLTLNYLAHDSNCILYLYNQYYGVGNPDKVVIKQLDFFKPNHDIFNYNTASYQSHAGTNAPNISGYIDGTLTRGDIREPRILCYDSFKSQIKLPGRDAFNMTFNSSLSGRTKTPTKVFNTTYDTIQLGAGLSAKGVGGSNETIVTPSSAATHSHNSSFMLFTPTLSGINNDITVCFDFALYTLTTGNSGYAQCNQDKHP